MSLLLCLINDMFGGSRFGPELLGRMAGSDTLEFKMLIINPFGDELKN